MRVSSIKYIPYSDHFLVLCDHILLRFQKKGSTRSQVCRTAMILYTVESTDPGASNGGSNVEIRFSRNLFTQFWKVFLPINSISHIQQLFVDFSRKKDRMWRSWEQSVLKLPGNYNQRRKVLTKSDQVASQRMPICFSGKFQHTHAVPPSLNTNHI